MKYFNKFLAIFLFSITFSSVAEVSVIVNSANNDVIDGKLIKKIFLGKQKTFANGTKVQVLSLDNSAPEAEMFFEKALKKSNSQYKSYWSKLTFTGKGVPPKVVASAQEMIDLVKSNTDAIGFVNSDSITGDVKVIAKF